MSGPVLFAVTSIVAIYACSWAAFLLYTRHCNKKWLNDRRPRKGVNARFYSRETCKKARAITEEDDMEGQAQSLIKSINEDWVK